MDTFDVFNNYAAELFKITTVKSVGIGIEPNISPADYPLIRIVPQRFIPEAPYNQRTCETGFYFGVNMTDASGREQVYKSLFELEAEIIKTIKRLGGRYFETVTDEQELDTYKLMYIRADIYVPRPEVDDA